MPLGAVPAGIAAESVGAPAVVAVSSLLFIGSVALIFLALPAFRSFDDKLEQGRARELARRELPRETRPAAAARPAEAPPPSPGAVASR
ncbi:MAG: hypothetical protein Q8S13_03705, partial [Dehalococcoidia bacterium]|nr:hypothetical protein [Dehalococcoidia bacterium]